MLNGNNVKNESVQSGKQTENLTIDKYFQEFDKYRFMLHNK